jgi:hypothetical protein
VSRNIWIVANSPPEDTDSVTLVASSALYDPSDEFQFHWDDSELGVPWPAARAHLSQRDRQAQPLRSLIRQIERLQTPAEAPVTLAARRARASRLART